MTNVNNDVVTKAQLNRMVATKMGFGLVLVSIPVGYWWQWSLSERKKEQKNYADAKERRDQQPESMRNQDPFGILLASRCLPGDVILFDKKVERCCASPWSALSCLVAKTFLCNIGNDRGRYLRTVESGSFDHIGLVVPGYVNKRSDKHDSSNLLLLEATPSGIVARNLRERIEQSSSRSVMLVQVSCPGEVRDGVGLNPFIEDFRTETSQAIFSRKTRTAMETELCKFRDVWIDAGVKNNYQNMHSTIAMGGAFAYALGIDDINPGPVSPSAYLVLSGLQTSLAAQSIKAKDNKRVKVEDFLRSHYTSETDSVRLRPGWRFLAPIPLRDK